MNNNVIVLGAGFSYDAGIPLLSGFIERMWEYSIRGQADPKILDILSKALKVRSELDGYHGRVSFDDRNIEDILSMLAFNVLGGDKTDEDKFGIFTKAISETIELACNVKHPGYCPHNGSIPISTGNELYNRFWKALFAWFNNDNSLPTIITFNYDLVLERSIFEVLVNNQYGHGVGNTRNNKLPFKNLAIDYKYQYFEPEYFQINYVDFHSSGNTFNGTALERIQKQDETKFATIELLKLHGSLNFPQNQMQLETVQPSLTQIIENPYLLPPVSNKHSNGAGDESWRAALNSLRNAKNVVFVGYSLPKTDIYMQFFLKAALGPNQNLHKLFVFDPILWRNNEASFEMQTRYEKCFAEQLRPRINFNPQPVDISQGYAGTTKHFVDILERDPSQIFF
ncbi:hypothetical protein JCM14076_29290 [Methylosoma difficile]